MTKHRYLFAGIIAVAGGLIISTADAAVATGYPGTFCRQELTTSSNVSYQRNRALNNGPAAFFACPAVQQGGRIMSANVYGRDLNAGASVSCHAEARNQFETAGFFTATVSSGSAFMGDFSFQLGFSNPLPGFSNPGSKVIHCSMPAAVGPDGSSISVYRIFEE